MMFGQWGNRDHDDVDPVIHAALDAGINFVDTADVYSQGESEEIVGKALAGGRRDDVVLADQGHGAMGRGPQPPGQLPRWLVREVENSLRRLQTDHIDLYQIHRPSEDTDIEETLDALTDLHARGQDPLLRLLDVPAVQIVEAQWAAEKRHSGRFVTEQPPTRCSSAASRPTCCRSCQQYDMGMLTWSPLAGGWLSGRWRKGQDAPEPPARRGRPSPAATTCPTR